MLSGLHVPGSPEYRSSLDAVCKRYWKPVYTFIRAGWSKSNEDAKDLAQAFFLWLMEDGALSAFDPQRGNFRKYLKVLLRSFVGHQDRALAAIKRGGGLTRIPMGDDLRSIDQFVAASRDVDPGDIFEQVWRTEIVCSAIETLRSRNAAPERGPGFQIFERYDLHSGAGRPEYKALAAEFGMSEAEIRACLYRIREELRREIRSRLAEEGLGDRGVDDEWKELLGR
jgi:RNA polymerase sigma factor (sigma-70 family)